MEYFMRKYKRFNTSLREVKKNQKTMYLKWSHIPIHYEIFETESLLCQGIVERVILF